MIVADTNLILALAVKTDASALAFSIRLRDSDWIAPPIWESEFRNGLLGMIRAGKIGPQAAVSAFNFAAENVDTLSVSTAAVIRIAEAHGLTAYDAEFAALSEWLGCKAVSFDDDLVKPGLAVRPQDF